MIYFARRESDGLIKIGRSARPIHRMRQLKVAHGCSFTLLGVMPEAEDETAGHTEGSLHFLFGALRRDGEFFMAGPDLLAFADENLHPLSASEAEAADARPLLSLNIDREMESDLDAIHAEEKKRIPDLPRAAVVRILLREAMAARLGRKK